MVKYVTAVIIGVAAYIIHLNCKYDLMKEKSARRIKYLLKFDPKRICLLVLSLAAALAVAWLFSYYGYGPLKTVRYSLLLAFLVPVAREDARTKQIPNRWILCLLAIRIVIFILETIYYPSSFVYNIVFTMGGGIVCGGIMYIACVLSRHALGMGDVKLFMILGLFLGAGVTYTIMFTSSVLAALYGLWKMVRKKVSLKDEIAFAPFIAAATVLVTGMGF